LQPLGFERSELPAEPFGLGFCGAKLFLQRGALAGLSAWRRRRREDGAQRGVSMARHWAASKPGSVPVPPHWWRTW
jgi:hypothetical protein